MPPFAFTTLFWRLRSERMGGEAYGLAQLFVVFAALSNNFLGNYAAALHWAPALFVEIVALGILIAMCAAHLVTTVKRLRDIGLPSWVYAIWFALHVALGFVSDVLAILFDIGAAAALILAPKDHFDFEDPLALPDRAAKKDPYWDDREPLDLDDLAELDDDDDLGPLVEDEESVPRRTPDALREPPRAPVPTEDETARFQETLASARLGKRRRRIVADVDP